MIDHSIFTKDYLKNSKGILCYVLVLFLLGCQTVQEKSSLNVILLVVDDMGYGDIGAHGNPMVKTPTFDYLHDHGARFLNFAVSPTCAPTRAAIFTGKHEFLSSVSHTIEPMRNMDEDAVTLSQLFNNQGYKTGLFGKWHLGQSGNYGPWNRGFEETLTVPDDIQDSHFDPVLLKNQKEQKYEGYRENILFEEAKKFITKNKEDAFFCYLATYSPHAPNIVPSSYSDPYTGYEDNLEEGAVYKAAFNGQIANIDENLKLLMDHLDSLGLTDNTLLVVMGDNGGTWGVDTYNAHMRGAKGTPWLGGVKTFSFWKWGNQIPAGERKQMSGHVDILPTLAAYCGLQIPNELKAQLEGSSLKPILENPTATLDQERMQVHHLGRWDLPEIWADHKFAGCSVRWQDYMLVRNEPCNDDRCKTCYYARVRGLNVQKPLYTFNNDHYALTETGEWELFDIQSDPFQEDNIAKDNPRIVKKMSAHYEKWWSKVEVKFNGSLDSLTTMHIQPLLLFCCRSKK